MGGASQGVDDEVQKSSQRVIIDLSRDDDCESVTCLDSTASSRSEAQNHTLAAYTSNGTQRCMLPLSQPVMAARIPSAKHTEGQAAYKRSSKRIRELSFEEESDYIEDAHIGEEEKGSKKQKAGKAFACPFYRQDPIRYFDCINRKLNRIQDLKQHLQRRHTAPHSCSRCSASFWSSQLFENHVRSRSCAPRTSGAGVDTVSLTAQKLLSNRIDRKLTPENQWRKIWKILYEDPDTTQNPHLGSVLGEVLTIISDFCINDTGKVVSKFAQRQGLSAENVQLLQRLLRELLGEVQAHIEERPCGPTMRKTPAPAEETNSDGILPDSKPQIMSHSAALNPKGNTSDSESFILPDETFEPSFDFSVSLGNASDLEFRHLSPFAPNSPEEFSGAFSFDNFLVDFS